MKQYVDLLKKALSGEERLDRTGVGTRSTFGVIEARVNAVDSTLEQVIYDPLGARLPRVAEGELMPRVTVRIVKAIPASIHDNQFVAALVLP